MEKRDGLGHTTKAIGFVSLGNNSKGEKINQKMVNNLFLLYNTILGKRGLGRRQKKMAGQFVLRFKREILHNLIALT